MKAGSRAAGGILAGAATIAAVTVVARLAGLIRQLVFQHAVGPTDLGSAYQTANTVPNVLFEVVAGGALASAVVPVLAGALARGDRDEASRTLSALLTWVLIVLVPVSATAGLLARPLMGTLLHGQGRDPAAVLATGTRFLLAFLPQVVLYGLAVVGGAALQAGRRFFWPAAAPLVSSLVVTAAYLGFEASAGPPLTPRRGQELVLSLGTTAGVLALAVCMLLPLHRLELHLRPSLSFPDGVAERVRRLAGAGVLALAAQQVSVLVVLRLANGSGSEGATVTYANAWMVFLLPYAVLAVPLATSAYPRLAAAADEGERRRFDEACAATARAVLAACAVGAAVLLATADPVARAFAELAPGGPGPAQMARTLVAFAPGLVGYGLVLHLSRALYALGRARLAAAATSVGWLGVVLTDVVLVAAAPDPGWVVPALGLGNTAGMVLGATVLAGGVRRAAGGRALAGMRRTTAGALAGMLLGGAAGALVALVTPGQGLGSAALSGLLAGAGAASVAGGCVALADRDSLRRLLRRPAGTSDRAGRG